MEKEKYIGEERRKSPRINVNFVVSYRIKNEADNHDLTQSRNVSAGGMLLTTNRKFEKGTILAMCIRFPFFTKKIEINGEVVDSKEIVRNVIYETRIRFAGLEDTLLKELHKYIHAHLKTSA
ncbi:MAG: PilZ domain-containing protein [Candidatus Omnitrophica bacterium]|nr:PilZ domain-containing protein [Candidatus Omnitrophota bacterium]MCM8823433.1 PilZ domain-containing protein [Candidatus Omnitrophota bacterium]MCM8826732.1 PilZ domain-containing protein [Candidatus Omnitrophota bacterium]